MVCTGCGYEGSPTGSTFCESCGEALRGVALPGFAVPGSTGVPAGAPPPTAAAPAVAAESPETESPAAAATTVPDICESCGAGPDKVDAQGICVVCGEIRVHPARDRMRVSIDARHGANSDIGKRHWRNEDYVAMTCESVDGRQAVMFVVSDGVSTSQHPDDASRFACETALNALRADFRTDTFDANAAVNRAIFAAHAAVVEIPHGTGPRDIPPEATILVACLQGKNATVGWLGDTRAYAVTRTADGARIVQVTEDHSWANEVVRAGAMTMQEAMADRRAHAITQSLGEPEPGIQPEPSIKTFPLEDVTYLIGCTDGFWNYAHPDDSPEPAAFIDLIRAAPPDIDAVDLATRCVDFANAGGGQDNITVAVVTLS